MHDSESRGRLVERSRRVTLVYSPRAWILDKFRRPRDTGRYAMRLIPLRTSSNTDVQALSAGAKGQLSAYAVAAPPRTMKEEGGHGSASHAQQGPIGEAERNKAQVRSVVHSACVSAVWTRCYRRHLVTGEITPRGWSALRATRDRPRILPGPWLRCHRPCSSVPPNGGYRNE